MDPSPLSRAGCGGVQIDGLTHLPAAAPSTWLQIIRYEDVFQPSDSKIWLSGLMEKYNLPANGDKLKFVSGYKNSVRIYRVVSSSSPLPFFSIDYQDR